MEKKDKFYKVLMIVLVAVVVAIAIITTCILNSKERQLDDLNDKNDRLEDVLQDQDTDASQARLVDIPKILKF